MTGHTASEFIKSLQGSGVLLVREGKRYFIPLSTLNECKLPEAFQANAVGISPDYFEPEVVPANFDMSQFNTPGQISKKMDLVMSNLFVCDGISQAVWISRMEEPAGGKPVSKAEGSKQVVFVYNPQKKKILVDVTRGGRPSDR